MGTGYVPRLLCWMLLGLGVIDSGSGAAPAGAAACEPIVASAWRAVLSVHAWRSLVFALSIERLGLVVVDPAAHRHRRAGDARQLRPLETVARGAGADRAVVGHLHLGLGLTIPVWPDW